MRELHYHLVDVFTDRAFGGNPLAVFPTAHDLSAELMQAIAKEFNLSETTFVLPPTDPNNHYRVRIFTPAAELPMAGHPTIGTAFVLAKEQFIEPAESETTVILEEGVGPVPVRIEYRNRVPEFIQMQQPLPVFGPRFDNVAAIAEMLSVEVSAITATGLPLEVVSCGVPFLFVPLRDLPAMRRIQFRPDVWARVLKNFAAPHVFVFTREVETKGATIHSRMFAPALGIAEDPATGAANGPVGCYLVRYGLLGSAAEVACLSEQGFEMGRPSFIRINLGQRAGEITSVKVGGQCYWMGQGRLVIDD